MKWPKCQVDNSETSRFCAACGSPLPAAQEVRVFATETMAIPAEELTPGSVFAGRYQVIEELGKERGHGQGL